MLFQPTTEKCMFYVESDVLDDCWDAFDHNLWLKKTIRVMKEQEIADPEVMKEFLQKLTKVSMDARQFINQYPESFRLLEEIARA